MRVSLSGGTDALTVAGDESAPTTFAGPVLYDGGPGGDTYTEDHANSYAPRVVQHFEIVP